MNTFHYNKYLYISNCYIKYLIFHPDMWSHDCIKTISSSYIVALCNSLPWLRAPIHAENTWKNPVSMGPLSFLFLYPFYTSTNVQTHTHTGTTSMPCDLARHYANGQTCHLPEISLRHSERERENRREKDSAHLPVCESSLSSGNTVHTQRGRNVAAATFIRNVL